MSEEIKNIIAEVELTLDITIKPMVLFQRQHIKQLLDLITNLQTQLQQKENIIKVAREYIEKDVIVYYVLDPKLNKAFDKTNKVKKELLDILDKKEE